MRTRCLLPILAGLLAAIALPCGAIEPEKMEGVAYRLDAFAASEYTLAYAPPPVEEIRLIAGSRNAFDPRHTLIYYWPLTREYFQAWETLDVEAEGRLEILKGERLVRTLDREPVGFHTPPGSAGPPLLVSGEEALRRQAEHAARQERYTQEMARFGEEMVAYQRELRGYMQRSRQAGRPGPVPQPPAEPRPPEGYVSDLKSAFVVDLPAGEYTVRLREEHGTVVEGSERRVSMFEPLAVGGIGYEILPEERWTARLRADTVGSGIYCICGKEMFLIPHRTETYAESDWLRLKNPQLAGLAARPTVIHVGTPQNARLLLFDGAKEVRRIDLAPYYVQQARGAELGYRIVEWNRETAGGDGPSFSAFRLRFGEERTGKRLAIALEDAATGEAIPGSRREIRLVDPRRAVLLWPAALAPFALGAGMLLWRRRLAWKPGRDE
jgi:hypothetical protein